MEEKSPLLKNDRGFLLVSSPDYAECYVFYRHGLMAFLKRSSLSTNPLYQSKGKAAFTYAGFEGEWGEYTEKNGSIEIVRPNAQKNARYLVTRDGINLLMMPSGGMYREVKDKDFLSACAVLPLRRKSESNKNPAQIQFSEDLAWWTRGVLFDQELLRPKSPLRCLYMMRQYRYLEGNMPIQ